MNIRRHVARRRWLIAAAFSAALAFPIGVLASHQFADVPDGHTFHGNISAIRDAGITAGCGGGNYCPDEAVSRGQMAAFMHRGFGRVAQSTAELAGSVSDVDGTIDVGSVTVNVPGTSGTQFVRVEGAVTIFGSNASCPCNVGFEVSQSAGGSGGPNRQFEQLAVAGYNQRTIRTAYVFAVSPGNRTFYFNVSTDSTSAMSLTALELTATTFPFGSTGTNVLGAAADGDASGNGSTP